MLDAGVDCVTSGEPRLGQAGDRGHRWTLIPQLLRPLDYPAAPARKGIARGAGQAVEGAGRDPQPLRAASS